MEICSRALSFWAYQTSQERFLLENFAKKADEKGNYLQKQLQQIVSQASNEINCSIVLCWYYY